MIFFEECVPKWSWFKEWDLEDEHASSRQVLLGCGSEADESNCTSASPSSVNVQALLRYLGCGLAEQPLLHKQACQARSDEPARFLFLLRSSKYAVLSFLGLSLSGSNRQGLISKNGYVSVVRYCELKVPGWSLFCLSLAVTNPFPPVE